MPKKKTRKDVKKRPTSKQLKSWKKNPIFKAGDKKGFQPVQAATSRSMSWWARRGSITGERAFSSPENLWKVALEYFQAQDENPEVEHDYRGGKYVKVKKKPIYTVGGLCLFCDVSIHYFNTFKYELSENDPQREAWLSIFSRISSVIEDNKRIGASVGLFKENFIALDLGMKNDNPADKVAPPLRIEIGDGKAKELLERTLRDLRKIDNGK